MTDPVQRAGTGARRATVRAMCGIVGAIGGHATVRLQGVERALPSLAHRGPDGAGRYHDDHVTLGHTRLAIIDPTAASDQPMIDEATGCVLVYNGEIYNYVELRRELDSLRPFHSAGDTEVLLQAYLEWGVDALPRLNGMFAFALWDPRHGGRLLLARDRLGEKPLQLARSQGALWFASEAKALAAAGVGGRRADVDAVYSFLALGDVAHPGRTFFDDISQLSGGELLMVDTDGREHRQRYWEVPRPDARDPVDVAADGASQAAEAFAELFTDSVRIRLRSDVPLGTSLSGGLDSTAVVASLRALRAAGDLHAFTAGFPGSPADELPLARAVADGLGLTLHEVPLRAEDLADGFEALAATHDGPVGSASVFAQHQVMAAAHDAGITVLLDGQGADETWLGYDVYSGCALVDDWVTGHPRRARTRARTWAERRGHRLRPPLTRYAGLVLPATARRRAVAAAGARSAQWLTPAYRHAHRGADPLAGIAGPASRPGRVAVDYATRDIDRLILPRLLQYADGNSMAASREVRLPFLDHRLVELAARTPLDQRIVDGWTKEPVRRLLEKLGQPATARRTDKLAYQPPHDEWLGYPALVERVEDAWSRLHRDGLLTDPRPSAGPLVRWRVLSVATWAQRYGLSLT
jgi:asparagine synthase (glutamine-hydrolysing)